MKNLSRAGPSPPSLSKLFPDAIQTNHSAIPLWEQNLYFQMNSGGEGFAAAMFNIQTVAL